MKKVQTKLKPFFLLSLIFLLFISSVSVAAVDGASYLNHPTALTENKASQTETMEENEEDENQSILKEIKENGVFNYLFNDLISNFFADIINGGFEIVDKLFTKKLLPGLLKIELLVSPGTGLFDFNVLNNASVASIYHFMYVLAASLVTIKFLWKGFQVYILNRSGDADTSPTEWILGVGEGIAIMVCFPILYDILARITQWVAEKIMSMLGGAVGFTKMNFKELFLNITHLNNSIKLVSILLLLVYTIMTVVLIIKLLARGVELFVMRMGVPIACLGLVDSDDGIFRGYTQQLFKTMFTTIIQICLFALSLRLISSVNLLNSLLAIAFLLAGLKTPNLLQSFLITGSGRGGLSSALMGASQSVSLVKSISAFAGK